MLRVMTFNTMSSDMKTSNDFLLEKELVDAKLFKRPTDFMNVTMRFKFPMKPNYP